MNNISVLIVLAFTLIFIAVLVALVRLAYRAGRAEVEKQYAEEKRKRAEEIARDVHEFNQSYPDLLDEDLRNKLRNL